MADVIHSFRFPPGIDRGRGMFAEELSHAEHVEQMMLQVLFTAPGERIDRPDFGCGLAQTVFAPNSETAAELLNATIKTALDKWLGTVIRVDDVVTRANDATLEVRVSYLLRARQERRILNLEVTKFLGSPLLVAFDMPAVEPLNGQVADGLFFTLHCRSPLSCTEFKTNGDQRRGQSTGFSGRAMGALRVGDRS